MAPDRLDPPTSKRKRRELGFDLCGIAPAGDLPELAFFPQWLARGYAGEMAYLARSAERRADVRHVLPSARSVIVTGTIYNTDRPYSTECADPARAQIARYAWGDDYHDVIERAPRRAARVDARRVGRIRSRRARYVDTGPVQERVYAQHAGIGWIGKNTCVINPAARVVAVSRRDHLQPAARGGSRRRSTSAARARCASRRVRRRRSSSPASSTRRGASRI